MADLRDAFNPNMINEFKSGIELRNFDKVSAALKSGVKPTTHLRAGRHPLQALVLQPYEANKRATQRMSKEDYQRETSDIIGLLFRAGAQVTEPGKYETKYFEYLADATILTPNVVDASTVVIKALHETACTGRAVYKPSIEHQCMYYLTQMEPSSYDDCKACVNEALTMMEELHETVRQRLESPRLDEEKDILGHMSYDLEYWLQPFERPEPEDILANIDVSSLLKKEAPGESAAAQESATGFAREVAQYMTKLEKKQPQDVLDEIDRNFIGCDSFKKSLRKMIFREKFNQQRADKGFDNKQQRFSKIYTGNPGLGKTTGARAEAELLHAMGKVGPNFFEVSREKCVGGFLGQTEQKMVALFQMADVLFIDEAYSLSDGSNNGDNYGARVIEAMLTAVENNPKLVVFLAGYTDEMETMISSNPGLRSRFTRYEHFEDLNRKELGEVLDLMLGGDFVIAQESRAFILDELEKARENLGTKDFGNARLVRTIAEQLPDAMAERLFADGDKDLTEEELRTVTLADVQNLDLPKILGTVSKSRSSSDGESHIGFTATLKDGTPPGFAIPARNAAPANDAKPQSEEGKKKPKVEAARGL